ncbi:MAG: SGNH/GDSL hydrolase family protein [Planctomycetota bacterium]
MLTRRQLFAGTIGGALAFSCDARTTAMSGTARHIVLVGDSIFDNKRYVYDQPSVIEQLRAKLPSDSKATQLAVDGDVTTDVARQLAKLPKDATHIVVSVGGNDALKQSGVLTRPAKNAAEVFLDLAGIQEEFDQNYRRMLDAVVGTGLPTMVCTIYDPNYSEVERQRIAIAALSIFNDRITRAAARQGVPLIDLRLLFDSPNDYANPIEPSPTGGAKIVAQILAITESHDFSQRRTSIYAGRG